MVLGKEQRFRNRLVAFSRGVALLFPACNSRRTLIALGCVPLLQARFYETLPYD